MCAWSAASLRQTYGAVSASAKMTPSAFPAARAAAAKARGTRRKVWADLCNMTGSSVSLLPSVSLSLFASFVPSRLVPPVRGGEGGEEGAVGAAGGHEGVEEVGLVRRVDLIAGHAPGE